MTCRAVARDTLAHEQRARPARGARRAPSRRRARHPRAAPRPRTSTGPGSRAPRRSAARAAHAARERARQPKACAAARRRPAAEAGCPRAERAPGARRASPPPSRAGERRERGQRVHDVADRGQPDDEGLQRRILARSARVSWSFGSPDDRHPAAVRAHDVPLGDGVGRVVGALAVNVGPQRAEQARDVVLVEDDDVVHGAQGGHEQRAVLRRHHRPPLALQAAHGRVAVDADHEHVGLGPGCLEIAHVSDVQDVEAAVGEGHRLPLAAGRLHPLAHGLERGHLAPPPPSPPLSLADGGHELVGGDGGGGVLHHDDAAGVVGEARRLRGRAPAASARVKVAITVSPAPVTSATWSVPWMGMCSGGAAGLEERHAVAAARDEHGLAAEPLEKRAPAASSRAAIVADGDPERLLDLGLVRRHRGHAPETEEPEARVHGHGDPAVPPEGDGGAHERGVEEPEP